ncbi:YadA C-terminal domain-containing protein [Vibrio splendidus]|uniref:YadA C-terminal domain-containing protein n=1 Tax=Vibrio splendidus TaxID=29497 RepID=UPI000CB8EDD5|nr:YadA C-terminal domain-containing protein [Vibrio splendidus]PMK14832.1 hypothetical protein BCU10_15495 [Vibrio splendidus]
MKKTIIALSLATVFADPAFAATDYTKVSDVENAIKAAELSGRATVLDGPNANSAIVHDNKTGETVIIQKTEDGFKVLERDNTVTNFGTKNGEIRTVNGKDVNNDALPDTKTRITEDRATVVDHISKTVEENNLTVDEHGQVWESGENGKHGEQVGKVSTDKDGNVTIERFNEHGKNEKVTFREVGDDRIEIELDETANNNGHDDNNNVMPDINNSAENRNSISEMNRDANAYATATDAKLANHESRIGSLEKDMQAMGNKMLVLEDRMDGVVASSHAITNARPVLNSAGQFGMGVGMGAAGSKQAIAIGGAYQISDNWSGTMSVNYETKGKVSNDQLSAGVGAQYIF